MRQHPYESTYFRRLLRRSDFSSSVSNLRMGMLEVVWPVVFAFASVYTRRHSLHLQKTASSRRSFSDAIGGFPHPCNICILQWFWEVVKDFSEEDKSRFLQFCTGTSRLPPHGFKALQVCAVLTDTRDLGVLKKSFVSSWS